MVGPTGVPAQVAEFIAAHVRTIEQLELLLLLIQGADRWWDASGVVTALGVDAETARRTLDHLAAHNLLAIRITGDVRYQFQPGEAQLGESARLLAEFYRVNRLGVLQLIAEPERRSMRAFSDAFRFRRK